MRCLPWRERRLELELERPALLGQALVWVSKERERERESQKEEQEKRGRW